MVQLRFGRYRDLRDRKYSQPPRNTRRIIGSEKAGMPEVVVSTISMVPEVIFQFPVIS